MPGYDKQWEIPMSEGEAKKRRMLKLFGILGLAALFIGVGITAGYFIGRAANKGGGTTNTSSSSSGPQDFRVLPPPGSAEAQALIADPDTPPHILDIYQTINDTETLNANLTARFLRRLEGRVKDLGQQQVDLTPFVEVAESVVDVLRVTQSTALLTLLRQYANEGRIVLEEVDMDELQQEVNRTLQLSTLDLFFKLTSRRDSEGSFMFRAGNTSRSWPVANTTSSVGPSEQPSGRHLLGRHGLLQRQAYGSPSRRHLHHAQEGASAPDGFPRAALQHRKLAGVGAAIGAVPDGMGSGRGLQAAASIPVIDDTSVAGSDIPTQLPVMSLDAMLCATSWKTPSPQPKCKAPEFGLFSYQSTSFKPVKIPITFHLVRYTDTKGFLQPNYPNPLQAAQNVIDATNALYTGSHISFTLSEVRYDPKQHPYLLLDGTLDDWQQCGASDSTAVDGFSCITGLMKKNGAKDYSVNVVVVSAAFSAAYCDFNDEFAACNKVYLGYSFTNGPWMTSPSATWAEDNLAENWIFVTWDYIAPEIKNNAAKWQGGAATLGHELGHYLGLRHTHEGGCSGDGITSADAVPDTPQNQDVQSFAAQKKLSQQLARWCASYRKGEKTDPKDLMVFNSCPSRKEKTVDNVFNILSYVPDACVMMFTENQVARMQWSIANHRPKMFAKYS